MGLGATHITAVKDTLCNEGAQEVLAGEGPQKSCCLLLEEGERPPPPHFRS